MVLGFFVVGPGIWELSRENQATQVDLSMNKLVSSYNHLTISYHNLKELGMVLGCVEIFWDIFIEFQCCVCVLWVFKPVIY